MPTDSERRWRFVSAHDAEPEHLEGKTHYWYCRPDLIAEANLLFVRARLEPGHAHRFHYHPAMEEILYVLSGTAEQWAESEKRMMHPGDTFYVAAGVVHATFNAGDEPLDFLAVLSPGRTDEPVTIEVGDQEPWASLRP